LAEGGQLVKPGPGRPGYGGHLGHHQAPSAPESTSGGNGGYQTVHDTGAITQTPGRTTTTTVERDDGKPLNIHRDTGLEEEAYVMVDGKKVHESSWGTKDDPREQIQHTGNEDLEEQLAIDKENALRKLRFDTTLTKNERQNLEVGLGFRKATPKRGFWGTIGNIALSLIPGLLPAKMAMAWKVGQGVYDYKQGYYDKYLPAQFRSDGKFATDIANTVTENAEKRKTDKAEQDLINSLPRGHPERIQLEELKKETPDDVPDRNGAIQETGTSITIEPEKVNDAKTQLLRKYQEMNDASRLAWERQQQMNRDKQMAYYRMMMKPYFTGAAQGGRVPQGYNTGGLSNLFKLKNV